MKGLKCANKLEELGIKIQDTNIENKEKTIEIKNSLENFFNVKMITNYKDRYNRISKSKWFINAYKNMSVGDVILTDGIESDIINIKNFKAAHKKDYFFQK